MMVPLHLHGFWVLFLLIYLLVLSVLVTGVLVWWWVRRDPDDLDRWADHKLVTAAVFGLVLAGAYWTWVITGAPAVLTRDPVQLGLHLAGSSAGITGTVVLWLRHHT